MEKTKLIVFDIDGTLTDSVEMYHKIFKISLEQMGIKEFNAYFNGYKHHTDSYMSKEIYELATSSEFSIEKLEEFENRMFENIQKEGKIEEISNALKIVDYLENETEYGVCFATGSLLKTAEYKLNQIGVNFSPKQLVASNTIFDREGIVSKAITQAKEFYQLSDFKQIISIGDGIWDLKTARNLNLDFIGIGEKNKDLLINNGAKVYLNDFINFELDLINEQLKN